jgi:peptidoglycan/LPS O-acetylase OafA/YrhL
MAIEAARAAEAPAPARATPEHAHMPPLDGLRGVAILLVLVGHICESLIAEFGFRGPVLVAGSLGWAGVDLFFVLSGFLITGILYDSKNAPHFYKNFYARRALRIFPLYYLALTLVLIASHAAPALGVWGTENPGWTWIYMTNFMLGLGGPDIFGVVDHFWSLAVEEHYYLIWPTFVFFLNRRALMWVAGAAMAIAFALRVSQTDFSSAMSMAGYAFTPMRMDSLAAGSLIALLVRGPLGISGLAQPGRYMALVGALAFAVLLAIRQNTNPDDPWLGTVGLSVLWFTFAGVLITSLTWGPAIGVMTTPVLRWFGKYSYGMYVWHPLFVIVLVHTEWARGLRGGNGPLDAAIWLGGAMTLAILMALLSWHVWEKQFLKLKGRFA